MIAYFKDDNDNDDFAIEDKEDPEPMTLALEGDNDDTEEAHHENPQSAQVGLEDLAGSFFTMAVSNISSSAKKACCMDVQLPYFLYNYVKDGHNYCSVDFLVMAMPREMVCPKVAPGGMVMQLGIVVPPRFVMEERLVQANEGDHSFNSNTHKATAFKAICEKIAVHHGEGTKEEPILGKPQDVPLPFKCEDKIVDWEIQGFPEEWGLSDAIGHQQFHFVISIDLVSVVKARSHKKKGGLQIFALPTTPKDKNEEEEEKGDYNTYSGNDDDMA